MDADFRRARDELFSLGAPLYGEEVPVGDVNAALVRAITHSHRDATAARCMPLCLIKNQNVLNDNLLSLAVQADEGAALGFYLDLTSLLSGDPRFSTLAEGLHDERRAECRYFFLTDERTEPSRKLAVANTPEVALRWGYWMNMPLDVYASLFEKFSDGKKTTKPKARRR